MRQSGVTLIEIAVILAIVALLAVAIFPSLGNVLEIMRSKGASEEVAGAIRLTRQYAITKGNDHCVTFSGSPNTDFAIFEDPPGAPATCDVAVQSATTIGHGLAVVTPNNLTITFNPIGNVTPSGTVTLSVDTSPASCLSSVLVTIYGGVRVQHGC